MTQAANLAALGSNTNTTGILPAAGGGTGTASGVTGFKNRLINGAMVIDQRSAGASTTVTTTGYFSCDRWQTGASQSSKFSIQQNAGSVTPPAGFTNYLGITSTSSYSVAASDTFYLLQQIEGYNIADLGWGSANAKTVTFSFWVRSSLTGTFSGFFYNGSGTRSYVFNYTISSANTWEQKSVTIAGDITGTWSTTNAAGIGVGFSLGYGSNFLTTAGSWNTNFYGAATGSVNVVGTNGATFYITGVQLEVGSTATSFDYRPYTTELQLAQRYYQKSFDVGTAPANSVYSVATPALANYVDGWNTQFYIPFCVTMRSAPSLTFFGGSAGKWQTQKTDGSWGTILGSTYPINTFTTGFSANNSDFNGSTGWQNVTAGTGRMARGDWTASAEL